MNRVNAKPETASHNRLADKDCLTYSKDPLARQDRSTSEHSPTAEETAVAGIKSSMPVMDIGESDGRLEVTMGGWPYTSLNSSVTGQLETRYLAPTYAQAEQAVRYIQWVASDGWGGRWVDPVPPRQALLDHVVSSGTMVDSLAYKQETAARLRTVLEVGSTSSEESRWSVSLQIAPHLAGDPDPCYVED